jgi:hypothetical protein
MRCRYGARTHRARCSPRSCVDRVLSLQTMSVGGNNRAIRRPALEPEQCGNKSAAAIGAAIRVTSWPYWRLLDTLLKTRGRFRRNPHTRLKVLDTFRKHSLRISKIFEASSSTPVCQASLFALRNGKAQQPFVIITINFQRLNMNDVGTLRITASLLGSLFLACFALAAIAMS